MACRRSVSIRPITLRSSPRAERPPKPASASSISSSRPSTSPARSGGAAPPTGPRRGPAFDGSFSARRGSIRDHPISPRCRPTRVTGHRWRHRGHQGGDHHGTLPRASCWSVISSWLTRSRVDRDSGAAWHAGVAGSVLAPPKQPGPVWWQALPDPRRRAAPGAGLEGAGPGAAEGRVAVFRWGGNGPCRPGWSPTQAPRRIPIPTPARSVCWR